MHNERIYLLKISLCGIEPEIWRRFVVPGDISLDRLHDVIQIVMGWEDHHLFEFRIGKKRYIEGPETSADGLECGKNRLVNLIKQKGREFTYVYDFGDYWEHRLVIEDSRYDDPDLETDLACLEGERACPPEDVGGPESFADFLEAMKDPNHGQHQDYRDWLGEEFEPEEFDVDLVNYQLMRFQRWSRDRYRDWYDYHF